MEDKNTQQNSEQSTEITFDELLKDPNYQAEFDKKVAKAMEKAKAKWVEESEKKRTEAEQLAKMTAEEKHQHELKKVSDEKEQAIKELNSYKLKDEALKIAKEKGLDISLLDMFDYSNETAENLKAKLETLNTSYAKAVEKAVNEKLKQSSPKQVEGNPTKKEVSRASF